MRAGRGPGLGRGPGAAPLGGHHSRPGAFGGTDLGTLYITTGRENFTPADLAAQPHAGDIFACTPGVTGRPPFLFGR